MYRKPSTEPDYPFSWIDEIIEVTLNPERTHVKEIQAQQIESLKSKFSKETAMVWTSLKARLFNAFSAETMISNALQYQLAIEFLLERAKLNLEAYQDTAMKDLGRILLTEMEDLYRKLQKRYGLYLQAPMSNFKEKQPAPTAPNFKVFCKLTVDQMGIILKAADDSKLILSRSISLVFKTIVPHLSTANKKDISWDSMRSNSYHPEEADKEAAIRELDKLIQIIRKYK